MDSTLSVKQGYSGGIQSIRWTPVSNCYLNNGLRNDERQSHPRTSWNSERKHREAFEPACECLLFVYRPSKFRRENKNITDGAARRLEQPQYATIIFSTPKR